MNEERGVRESRDDNGGGQHIVEVEQEIVEEVLVQGGRVNEGDKEEEEGHLL